MDGRRMKIDSVDFQAGTVSLLDLDMKGWFPIFRSEPIPFVREFIEEAQRREEYTIAEVAAHRQRMEQVRQCGLPAQGGPGNKGAAQAGNIPRQQVLPHSGGRCFSGFP